MTPTVTPNASTATDSAALSPTHTWDSSCVYIWMMNDALVVARLCLAAVFFVAGATKLADRSGTRQALADFDVPPRLARPLLLLLPAAELATATTLVFPTTARWGAAGGLVLLALFVVGLTRVLRRGEAPDCHCFGQLHSKPASWTTVARNFVLTLPAAYVALAGPGPSLASWVASTDATRPLADHDRLTGSSCNDDGRPSMAREPPAALDGRPGGCGAPADRSASAALHLALRRGTRREPSGPLGR